MRVNYSELLQDNFLLQSCGVFFAFVDWVVSWEVSTVLTSDERRRNKMCLQIFCLPNIDWIGHFLSSGERQTIMLASCSLCSSDFGKQIGYCRWILGRWQNSSTCASYRALLKHFEEITREVSVNMTYQNCNFNRTETFSLYFNVGVNLDISVDVEKFADLQEKRCRDVHSEEIPSPSQLFFTRSWSESFFLLQPHVFYTSFSSHIAGTNDVSFIR